MKREIEAKVRVADLAAVERRAREIAGEPFFDAIIADHFFDTADGRLRDAGSGMRIRTARDGRIGDSGGSGGAVITFKGPRQPGGVKIREEIEVGVDDEAAARRLLGRLGFIEHLGYEKRRRSWRVGTCRVELDDVPLIGSFVEIEGPDEATIADVQRRLGLADHPQELRSYAAMLDEQRKAHQIQDRFIRFSG